MKLVLILMLRDIQVKGPQNARCFFKILAKSRNLVRHLAFTSKSWGNIPARLPNRLKSFGYSFHISLDKYLGYTFFVRDHRMSGYIIGSIVANFAQIIMNFHIIPLFSLLNILLNV